jgi:phage repressor protein C with HTH and peptisase S24 domain
MLRDQPGVITDIRVSAEWLKKNVHGVTSPRNLCIVTGFGDSMRPMFDSGDPLLVDMGVNSVMFDSVYFFRIEGEGLVKRLQRIPGEGLRVLSSNQSYETWTIKPDMDFEVLGHVVKAWMSQDF